jgi:GPH family glycoside/pentoside/hexuronide:cation symporter
MSYGPLQRYRLIAYSLPSAPTSMLMMMLVVYLAPFYASEMGLELAAVGGIFFLARLWDAVIDPVVGNLSDLTRSRFGRRKPWIALGTPALMITLYFFLQPPQGVTATYLAVSAVLFYIAITVVQIPYLSWGAELSRDYIQRIRINGYRETGTMIGILLVASIPLFFLRGTDPTVSDIVRVFTYVVLALLPLCVIPALLFAPQGVSLPTQRLTLLKALYALRVNKPFLRLMLASLFIWTGGHIYNSSSLFMIKDALGFSPTLFLWFMVMQYVVALLMMPLVMKIGARLGKHRTLLFVGLAFFPILWLFLLVEPQNLVQVLVIYALKGAVTAAIWIMPPALVADSIEHGILEGAGDDTALYMSLYFFIQKLAAAIGVGVALPVAALLGFNPQSTGIGASTGGIMFVAAVLPSIIALPAVFLLFNYPISEKRHAEIRQELRERGLET